MSNRIKNRLSKISAYSLNEKASEIKDYAVNEFIEYYLGYFQENKNIQLEESQKQEIRDYVLKMDSYGTSFSIDKIDDSVAGRIEEWIDSEFPKDQE